MKILNFQNKSRKASDGAEKLRDCIGYTDFTESFWNCLTLYETKKVGLSTLNQLQVIK